MKNVMVVVDVQNDFVSGTLGTGEASLIPNKINDFFTQSHALEEMDIDLLVLTVDSHGASTYEDTLEGKLLPVGHCFEGTQGIKYAEPLRSTILDLYNKSRRKNNSQNPDVTIIKKHTFGASSLYLEIEKILGKDDDVTIYICGLCTNICVITNALILRTRFPNAPIYILKELCAGTSVVAHNQALAVLESCQCIPILNDTALKGPTISNIPL